MGTRIENKNKNKIKQFTINPPTKEIIVISFDEESKDYNLEMIKKNSDFYKNVTNHNYVVLCTQKSKSSSLRTQTGISLIPGFSAKHFAHIFSDFMKDNNYVLVQKYDSATMFSAELTENISLRTRIYRKNDSNAIKNVKFSEIKNGSFRNYFRNTYNNSALLTTFSIGDKKYNIINTDLFSLKKHHRQMYNDGLFYKQQQFLAIIKDFKLYDKYSPKIVEINNVNNPGKKKQITIPGENIIIAGSLKFNIYPLKMTNILSEENMKIVNTYIVRIKKNKLKKYNELNKYLEQLSDYYAKKNIFNLQKNNFNKEKTASRINVIEKQSAIIKNENIELIRFKNIITKYQNEHIKIKELLDEFRKNLKMFITSISSHENNYTGKSVSYNPFAPKTVAKISESLSRTYSPLVKDISKKTAESIPLLKKSNITFAYENKENISGKKSLGKSNNTSIRYHTRSPNTPSVKERILYALTNEDENKKKIDYKIDYKIYSLNNNLVTLSIS